MKSKINRPARLPLDKAPLKSLSELEYLLGVPRVELMRLADWMQHYAPFKQSKALKPHTKKVELAKPREIDNPKNELKHLQSRILKRLLSQVELPSFLFGAVPKKSIRDHARAHLGQTTVVKMDIKSYYPSVTTRHVYSVWRKVLNCSPPVASLLTKLTTCNFHLPQGAPTSPALANLFLASIYGPVLDKCIQDGVTATVWVDDLTFSGGNAREVIQVVRRTLAAHGLKDSRGKLKILGPKNTKLITGVRLGKNGPRACRLRMREVRAGISNLRHLKFTALGCDRDIESLRGKIAHIRSLYSSDAKQLAEQVAAVLLLVQQ